MIEKEKRNELGKDRKSARGQTVAKKSFIASAPSLLSFFHCVMYFCLSLMDVFFRTALVASFVLKSKLGRSSGRTGLSTG